MKPKVYSRLYVHLVFATWNRQGYLLDRWREEVFKYISGILKGKGHTPIAVGGTKDHIHILCGYKPVIPISDIVRDVKRSSSAFINSKKNFKFKFGWQEGYGAFSVGHGDLNGVSKYIMNQEEHHRKSSFRKEYLQLLEISGIEYDSMYLFQFSE